VFLRNSLKALVCGLVAGGLDAANGFNGARSLVVVGEEEGGPEEGEPVNPTCRGLVLPVFSEW
jgi:hypothetical protein